MWGGWVFIWRFCCYALFLDKPTPTNGSAHWGTGSIGINNLDIKFMVGFQVVILLVLLVWCGLDRLYLSQFQKFFEQQELFLIHSTIKLILQFIILISLLLLGI
jgi:hypothetical protein